MSGEERLVGMLARELRGRSPEEAARRLLARGLVARGACERWLLREEVERRIAAGGRGRGARLLLWKGTQLLLSNFQK